jgi:NAD(P) transhydrogenase
VADYEFDLVVIGTGPGGEGAAMQACKHGMKVGVIERMRQIGGACTHVGTIPSKALRYAIARMVEVNRSQLFLDQGLFVDFKFPDP